MNVRTLIVWFVVAGTIPLAAAEAQSGRAASAPRPAAAANTAAKAARLGRAKTAFLINETPGPATDATFRDLQTQMRKRFTVVDRADRAEVTISLNTVQVERVTLPGGAPVGARLVNPKTATVRSNVSTVTVREQASGEILWTGKDADISIVARDLQQAALADPGVCVLVWCW
jgi:hypothetical protein